MLTLPSTPLATLLFIFCEVFLFGIVVVQHGHIETEVAISPAQLSPFFFQKIKINLFPIFGFEVIVVERVGMCGGWTPQKCR